MGRTLGGSSAINLGMAIFPGKAEFEAWSALGNKGWDHEGILPYLRKFHTYTGPSDKVKEQLHYQGDSELHGTDGPVQLSFGEDYLPFHAAWPLTFEAVGYKLTGDPILGIAVGPFSSAGAVDSSTKTRSHAAAVYYSRDVAKRPNLRVLTEAFVEKVVLEENKGSVEATGVQFVGKDGTRRVMFSRREVILAAGAFKTPQILELSGIGSSELLTSHGIPVFIDNANVGENLQDHGLVCGSWEVADGQVSGDSIRDPEVAAAAMQLYQASRSGPLSQFLSYHPSCLSIKFPILTNDASLRNTLARRLLPSAGKSNMRSWRTCFRILAVLHASTALHLFNCFQDMALFLPVFLAWATMATS
jgi:choline dehydrogenase-like flavoprotein